jgi:uncharacterized membrane protein
MKFFTSGILLVFLLQVNFIHSQGVQFQAKADEIVYVGERFNLIYTLNAEGNNFRGPDIKGLLVLSGPFTSTSSSVQVINGKVSRTVEYTYTYILSAGQEGVYEIPSAKVNVDGTIYESNSLKIQAIKGSSSQQGQQGSASQGSSSGTQSLKDDVFIRAVANKSNPTQGEEIIVTYKLYYRINISAPEFRKEPSFKGFWKTNLLEDRQSYVQYTEVYNGQKYNVAEIKKFALFPQKAGKIEIESGDAVCQGQVRAQSKKNNDPFFDNFFNDPFFNRYQNVEIPLTSNSVTIDVQPLPNANRPADFTGAVGDFNFESTIDKTELKANEAINLKFIVKGTGNIELVDKMNVSFPPDFEVYDPKINSNINANIAGVSGTKTFEYLIIPRTPGTFKINPVKFSYFDLKKNTYQTILSPEYIIKVGKGDGTTSNITYSGVNQADIKYIGSDIRHIKTRSPNFKFIGEFFFGSTTFYILMILPVLLFIAFIFLLKKELKKRNNIALMRNRKATKVAQKRMKKAQSFLQENNKNAFYEEVSQALWGYLSDKFSIPLSNLSMDTVKDTLLTREVEEDTISHFMDTLNHCEFARFAPGESGSDMKNIYDESVNIISKIESELK